MLMRNQLFDKAEQVILDSLAHHTLAGRLWGELILLEHI